MHPHGYCCYANCCLALKVFNSPFVFVFRGIAKIKICENLKLFLLLAELERPRENLQPVVLFVHPKQFSSLAFKTIWNWRGEGKTKFGNKF